MKVIMSGSDAVCIKLNERNGSIYVDLNLFSDASPSGWAIIDLFHNCVGTMSKTFSMFAWKKQPCSISWCKAYRADVLGTWLYQRMFLIIFIF